MFTLMKTEEFLSHPPFPLFSRAEGQLLPAKHPVLFLVVLGVWVLGIFKMCLWVFLGFGRVFLFVFFGQFLKSGLLLV